MKCWDWMWFVHKKACGLLITIFFFHTSNCSIFTFGTRLHFWVFLLVCALFPLNAHHLFKFNSSIFRVQPKAMQHLSPYLNTSEGFTLSTINALYAEKQEEEESKPTFTNSQLNIFRDHGHSGRSAKCKRRWSSMYAGCWFSCSNLQVRLEYEWHCYDLSQLCSPKWRFPSELVQLPVVWQDFTYDLCTNQLYN